MKVAITGAAGFIGQHLVESALAAGHDVLAIAHKSVPESWSNYNCLEVRRLDLTNSAEVLQAIEGFECIVHLAASLQPAEGYLATVSATRSLCYAMQQLGVQKLVLVSSIAVLDYQSIDPQSAIDERAPLLSGYEKTRNYASMKLKQEEVCREWADRNDACLVIVRPGMVYDNTRLSSAHAGVSIGSVMLAVAHSGTVPVVHVRDLCSFLLLAISLRSDDELFHLVGDSLPTQRDYLKALKERRNIKVMFPLHWRLYAVLATVIRFLLRSYMSQLVPDGFQEASVAARMTPYGFRNDKAHTLGWHPRGERTLCRFSSAGN